MWVLENSASALAAEHISLAGTWRFQLDREDAGITERWFERSLDQKISLPGALQNQGFGEDIAVDTKWTGDVGAERWLNGPQYAPYRQTGHIKVPFFLQPDKHFVGVAWYQREIQIPAAWQGRRVVLSLERAHWETSVWVDKEAVGTNNSLSAPHVYELGTGLVAGKHLLTLRVNNDLLDRINVGSWAHSVSDHTQGNWNGVIGRIELSATTPVWIDEVQVFPDVEAKSARVSVRIGNCSGRSGSGTVLIGGRAVPATWDDKGGAVETEVALGNKAQAWDEFNPALQRLRVQLKGDQADDSRSVSVGLREIRTQGKQFVLNNHKTFFRGTLECCIFPLTGYPPTDVESWKRIISICKSYGLNLIRFHSWCPPEAAFIAADELGFYYQVECAVWTSPGESKVLGDWIYAESERIVRAYGNHPSFVLMTHGNEPGGKHREEFLTGWVNFWKQRDPRRLITSGSAYPQLTENQYHVYYPCRGPHGWLGKDYRQDVDSLSVPVVVHEMGQWCAYPDFSFIKKCSGPLKARNFEIFRDSLTEHGMLEQARDFLHASGKLQSLCYKEEIEAALRTPGISGFELLDLHDFPGQGTALVGVLDALWDSKGYVSPQEFRRFCGPTIPLARLLKRVWTTGEVLSADVEVAHFGPKPLENVAPNWKLIAHDGRVAAVGNFKTCTIPVGQGIRLGRIEIALASLPVPQSYRLQVAFAGTPIVNEWRVWVYPANSQDPAVKDVLVVSELKDESFRHLESGGKVLLLPTRLPREHPRLGFEPIFWNRYMFNTQGRQTLGLLCNPSHPALAAFPTESFQDWQWDDIVSKGRGTVLDSLSRGLQPIVQVIDDWNTNRKLGLIWECRVGGGRLLVCSADLTSATDTRPAARQLRHSLLAYMSGPRFEPRVQIGKEALSALFQPSGPSTLAKLGARIIDVDSEDTPNGNPAGNAIDGDPATIWHTRWQPQNDPMPHHLTIDLGRELKLQGVTYLPRQDMTNGRIAECEIYCSTAPNAWREPTARVKWANTDELQTVRFPQPVTARYVKLVVRSEVNGNPFASIAELDVLPVKAEVQAR